MEWSCTREYSLVYIYPFRSVMFLSADVFEFILSSLSLLTAVFFFGLSLKQKIVTVNEIEQNTCIISSCSVWINCVLCVIYSDYKSLYRKKANRNRVFGFYMVNLDMQMKKSEQLHIVYNTNGANCNWLNWMLKKYQDGPCCYRPLHNHPDAHYCRCRFFSFIISPFFLFASFHHSFLPLRPRHQHIDRCKRPLRGDHC